VPDPKFPFLGVHFTRLIKGGIEAGPNAVLAFAREGYKWTDINLRDLTESVFFPGLWRFLFAYPSMCGYEIRRSLSREPGPCAEEPPLHRTRACFRTEETPMQNREAAH